MKPIKTLFLMFAMILMLLASTTAFGSVNENLNIRKEVSGFDAYVESPQTILVYSENCTFNIDSETEIFDLFTFRKKDLIEIGYMVYTFPMEIDFGDIKKSNKLQYANKTIQINIKGLSCGAMGNL